MLSDKEKEEYVSGWKRRQKEKETVLLEKHSLALIKARATARMLKEKYHAQKVILFGSLVKGLFWEHSDVDLAVSGFDETNYLDAFWDATQMTIPYKLDLIILEEVSEKFSNKIWKEGVEL